MPEALHRAVASTHCRSSAERELSKAARGLGSCVRRKPEIKRLMMAGHQAAAVTVRVAVCV